MPVDTKLEREVTFWTSCLPLRIVLASAITIYGIENIRILQIILATYMATWAIGYFVYFTRTFYAMKEINSSSNDQKKTELKIKYDEVIHGNFGGIVWWQWHRLVHGSLLLIYSILTFVNIEYAFVFGIADVVYGFFSGLFYYRIGRCCTIQITILSSRHILTTPLPD